MPSVITFSLLVLSRYTRPVYAPGGENRISRLGSGNTSVTFNSAPGLDGSFEFSLTLVVSHRCLSRHGGDGLFALPLFLHVWFVVPYVAKHFSGILTLSSSLCKVLLVVLCPV